MYNLKQLSETELVDQLTESLTRLADSKEKSKLQRLAHDLQTHQIELEMQNRELREAQQLLEEARDRYADLYDFAPVCYATFDRKGLIKNINLNGATMLGVARARTINQPFARWLESSHVSNFFNHLQRAFHSDGKVVDEIVIKGAQDKTIEVRIETLRSIDFLTNTYVCRSVVLDITDSNRRNNKIRRQARQLRLITDALPVLIAYINEQEEHAFTNKAYAEWFSSVPAKLIGTSLRETWGEQRYQAIRSYLKTAFYGKQVSFDIEFSLSDTEKKYINTTLIPDFDRDNRVCGVIALVGDITDRLAVEVVDRKHLLEAAHFSRLSTMGEMASEIAHELNQPLAAISIYSDACRRMVVSGKGHKDRIIESLAAISSQAERAGTVIRSIREFVGKKGLTILPLSANEIIEEALQLLTVEIRSHKAVLELVLGDNLPSVEADRVLIEQVVLNLARNALEAMDDIDNSRRLMNISTARHDHNTVKVSIADSGPGLCEEEISKIFDPFHTTKVAGMGMGLAISQSIIEAHHGQLWAVANDIGGTTFNFTLPLSSDENDYAE